MKVLIVPILFAFVAPHPNVVPNVNVDLSLKKTIEGWSAAGEVIGDNTQNLLGCAEASGCFKGYCWAKCGVGSRGKFKKWDAWCYTTKTYSQSFEYVSCNQDSDCNSCWKCAASCTW